MGTIRTFLPNTRLMLSIFVSALLCLLGACSGSSTNDQTITSRPIASDPQDPKPDVRGYVEFTGIVIYSPDDDGFYYLKAARQVFDPNVLPKKYQKNGLTVKIRARIRAERSSRLNGPMIQVVSIGLVNPIILTP